MTDTTREEFAERGRAEIAKIFMDDVRQIRQRFEERTGLSLADQRVREELERMRAEGIGECMSPYELLPKMHIVANLLAERLGDAARYGKNRSEHD